MTYRDRGHRRAFPRPHQARIAVCSGDTNRRRGALLAASVIVLAAALVRPACAVAGWPLEAAAPVELEFGATYAGPDGTASTHRGVDISAAAGSSVRAPLSGRVSFAGRVPAAGGGTVYAVTVANSGGSLTLMPLSSATIKKGTEVAQGAFLGVLAGEGDASSAAPHLHVGARRGDLYVDPMTLITAPSAPAPAETQQSVEPSPITQPKSATAPGAAAGASRLQATTNAGAQSRSAATAQHPARATGASAEAAGAGAPVVAAVPGASVAPGVSVAGATEPAAANSAVEAASRALSAAVAGSGEGAPAGALLQWAGGMASRGLQAGGRVLACVLLGLGALWPIWRRDKRKGASQLSVRPSGDDVAAVAGR